MKKGEELEQEAGGRRVEDSEMFVIHGNKKKDVKYCYESVCWVLLYLFFIYIYLFIYLLLRFL